MKLAKGFNSHIHYSFGDEEERPHIVFPASTFFERLVVTTPGESPPQMGEEFPEPDDSIQSRKAYKKKINWNTDDTYSMSFHTMYFDFSTWSIVNLPIGKDLKLRTFWGNSSASMIFYECQGPNLKHSTDLKRYVVSLKVS